MGNPQIYYKRALQTFAYSFNRWVDKKKADELLKETSIEILEKEINDWKEKTKPNRFYFEAGRTSEFLLSEVEKNEGIDAFNACIGGLNQFEDFLEIYEEE